jgi:hypothetical protein
MDDLTAYLEVTRPEFQFFSRLLLRHKVDITYTQIIKQNELINITILSLVLGTDTKFYNI